MGVLLEARTVPDLLADRARRYPDAPALVDANGSTSYAVLASEVSRVAKALIALDVVRGDKVAVLMGNRTEWMTASLAAQSIGAVTVALNTWASPREIAYALQHSDAAVLIAAARFLRRDFEAIVNGIAPRPPCLRHVFWLRDEDGLAPLQALGNPVGDETLEATRSAVSPDDCAYLVYSSGSTASPKGILLSHGSLIVNAWHIGERQHVRSSDRFWLAVSLFWSFGCVNAAFNALTHGACLVLQETFDAGDALELIERHRCTIFYGTPNMAHAMAQHPDRATRDLSSLRSGATLGTPEQLQRVVDLGAREICNVYGLTETYGNCAVSDAGEPLADRLNFVGSALPGHSIRICEIEGGGTLDACLVGEIRVKGRLLAGYFKDPVRTRAAFDADGYFRTGDLGIIDKKGRLQFRGRITEMVKSGGINIAPIEIEEMLMRHPSVEAAYVVGVPDPVHDEVLGAVVVPRHDDVSLGDELLALCRRELAAYKVPRQLVMVPARAIPLTTTGKVQKSRLVELLQRAAPVDATALPRTTA